MSLSGFIARRYLFAKKSHNVINIISIISATGIAVGCAALVIILSIYNGFDEIVRSLYSSCSSDLVILPAHGKVFRPVGPVFDSLRNDSRVTSFSEVLEENVFVVYGDNKVVATAKGIDSTYESVSGLRNHVIEGEFRVTDGVVNEVVLGRTLAIQLSACSSFLTPLYIYFPSRNGDIDLLDPGASLNHEVVYPSGIVTIDLNFDKQYLFVPIRTMRTLLQYYDEVSSIELNGEITDVFQNEWQATLGPDFVLKNRLQQNESIYKLLSYEKVAIYAILLFVMIIISCNIFGSLSMLIIEKRDDIATLRSLGAPDGVIKGIFVREGWMISLFGIVVGILAGLGVCWVQMNFGIVKMPGNFVVDAYPVVIKLSDIFITAGSVALIGYLTAVISRAALRNSRF